MIPLSEVGGDGTGKRLCFDERDEDLIERLCELGVLDLSFRCSVEEQPLVGDSFVGLTGVCVRTRTGVRQLVLSVEIPSRIFQDRGARFDAVTLL